VRVEPGGRRIVGEDALVVERGGIAGDRAREQVLVGRAGPHAVAPLVVAQHAPAALLDDVVVTPVVRRRRKRLGGSVPGELEVAVVAGCGGLSVPEGGHAQPPSFRGMRRCVPCPRRDPVRDSRVYRLSGRPGARGPSVVGLRRAQARMVERRTARTLMTTSSTERAPRSTTATVRSMRPCCWRSSAQTTPDNTGPRRC